MASDELLKCASVDYGGTGIGFAKIPAVAQKPRRVNRSARSIDDAQSRIRGPAGVCHVPTGQQAAKFDVGKEGRHTITVVAKLR